MVIVISFLPLLPELGVTIIQLSARVLTRDAVQSAVVVNEILTVPPSCDSTGFRFSELGIVISEWINANTRSANEEMMKNYKHIPPKIFNYPAVVK